jgi:hypothetical protein
METLDLKQAASFLKMNHQVLRRKAKDGHIPGKKTGKCWVFVEEHLADFISGRYPEPAKKDQEVDNSKEQSCQFTSEETLGGYNSRALTDEKYSNLLELPTNRKRKNFMTA